MEYLLDTANIEAIKKYVEFFPIMGVTSNPSIIKKEGKISFFKHMNEIRSIIGKNRSLHVQVLHQHCAGIMEDAKAILNKIDDKVFIKIPVTMEGLKAIQLLKAQGVNVTATAIYTKMQGFLAMEAGADYIAPYFNRMENMDIDPRDVIDSFAQMIAEYEYSTQIIAASFKNMGQVNDAFLCGAHAATIGHEILEDAFKMPAIQKAVDDFEKDWKSIFQDSQLSDL